MKRRQATLPTSLLTVTSKKVSHMAKQKKAELTEEQEHRNAAILARLKADRDRLLNDTRRLQEDWSTRKRPRRRHASVSG